jgi:glycyl-tRNA synthetase
MEATGQKLADKYMRREVEDLLKRKFFIVQAFEIYGGIAGLFDFGPLGAALKNNVEQLWRNHFVLEEDMLEISCTNLTPEVVLKTSGHVDKFEDFMVKDVKNGNCYRADKILEEHIEKVIAKKGKKMKEEEIKHLELIRAQADTYSQEEIGQILKDLKVKAPDTGNDLSEPLPFNLMFSTQIGPSSSSKGYFRPETAQGIFVNFKRLLESNNGRMPFAAAQIGLGFRNEIAPRAGLLRVREFTMAEIEHFCDPLDKTHRKFFMVKDDKLPLFSCEKQLSIEEPIKDMTIGEAVEQGIVNNETLGYYMSRTYRFFQICGIPKEAIRFRQHLKTEMAHYATDCWDCEIETSYGWIEIAGHADRSCYDLEVHSKATNTELLGSKPLAVPMEVSRTLILPDKKKLGKELKKDCKLLCDYLDNLTEEQKQDFHTRYNSEEGNMEINIGEKTVQVSKDSISIKIETKMAVEEKFAPHVIEPSFGIGRVIYCIFEHCFRKRPDDEKRTYFEFPVMIAPVKTSILPLISNNEEIARHVYELKSLLNKEGVSSKIDDSSQTIGRRYARTDECGIPFATTVDNDTLKDNTVTLREIHSTKQVRIPVADLALVILNLSKGIITWQDCQEKYPNFDAEKEEKEE